MNVMGALVRHARDRADAVAITDGATELCFAALSDRVSDLAAELTGRGIRRLGLLLDNGIDWALLDLAARQAKVVLVPIPAFFSDDQVRHVTATAALDHLVTDQAVRIMRMIDGGVAGIDTSKHTCGNATRFMTLAGPATAVGSILPGRTDKITFTSGTTGMAKGVCLSEAAIDRVTASLLWASEGRSTDRHLCLLPLPTLLENIAGIYVPLLAGATCCIPSLAEVGLSGSSQLDVATMLGAIMRFRPTTLVMVPQMLMGLLSVLDPDTARRTSLRLIAVGGAPLPRQVLEQAEALGMPVRQGYGLSECTSVVTVNSISENRLGSVGKTLPHAGIRIAADGEILVRGALCEGFLGEPTMPDRLYWPTGDIGTVDADGYLHLTGRKKHMFITSFGRNVAPEWIECELAIEPAISQAAVFGEGRAWNAAVIVPRPLSNGQNRESAQVSAAIERVNTRLPDYARVGRWILADGPFTPASELITPNGRLRRERIAAIYGDRLEHLYEEEAARVSR